MLKDTLKGERDTINKEFQGNFEKIEIFIYFLLVCKSNYMFYLVKLKNLK